MKKVTIHFFLLCISIPIVQAQQVEFDLTLSNSEDVMAGYATTFQRGARDIAGPYDLDGDGLYEILITDYTGGGRVHVIENRGIDLWELVYSTPWLDATSSTENARAVAGGDVDGDGFGEIAFLTGREFDSNNPNIANLPAGLYFFENVGDDNYGDAPASIYEFDGDLPDRWKAEQMDIVDVDDDGVEELLLANDGMDDRFDNWYVLSASDIGGNTTWNEELRLSSRDTEDFDPVDRGGGSPFAIHAADLGGDIAFELSLHSYNFFNFTNVAVTGINSYAPPSGSGQFEFYQATSPNDYHAVFGGIVVDIDGNGEDEIFYPVTETRNVAILNYESGEGVTQVTSDNLVLDVIPGLTSEGITASDLDGDGFYEIIGSGTGYGNATFENGNPASWISFSEFNGGDPEDPSNYSPVTSVDFPLDTYDSFHRIERMNGNVDIIDDLLDVSDRSNVILVGNNPEFASKFIDLHDADLDGKNELAFGIQGVPDSLYTLIEVAANVYEVSSTTPPVANDNRTFMKVITGSGLSVDIEDERIVLPNEYRLHDNYPNPFNPTTTINFTLPLDKAISVRVYDVTGRLVRTLIDNRIYTEGTHEVTWDAKGDAGNHVASGSYLYTLEYGNFRQSKTMVLIK